MAETKTQMRKPFKGAKVDWPADMPDDMLEDAITVAKNALETHDFEEQGVEVSANQRFGGLLTRLFRLQIASIVKKHMDERWEPFWHVFLGKSFGCHAVHERNRFVYFSFE